MNRTTVVLIGGLVVGAALVGTAFGIGVLDSGDGEDGLVVVWVSDTQRSITSNHHAPVAAQVDGTGFVFAPISGIAHDHDGDSPEEHAHAGEGCALVALDGSDGSVQWRDAVPATNCTVHSVADPAVGDIDGDGRVEVLATTTENTLFAFEPVSGDVVFRYDLSSYGYSQPLVADVTGDGDPELIVVDVRGSVFVVNADGSRIWTAQHDTYTWGQPRLADFDGEGDRELFVALGNGSLNVYDAGTGGIVWQRTAELGSSVTWTAVGDVDRDGESDVAVATVGGLVQVRDGATGDVLWSRDLGRFSAVQAIGDGDADGRVEVYAVARDGVLRSFTGVAGGVEWSVALTAADVQMMPPPVLGDVSGDGDPELVAVTNDGKVLIVDPTDGSILGTYAREVPIRTHATLGDVDGDDRSEIVVMYGDGRVVVLEYRQGNTAIS